MPTRALDRLLLALSIVARRAFVTTSLAEQGHYIATGQVAYLSEQQLIDCSKGNKG